ncbi:MAG: MetQ/NlpA family ABC transporter substrate-binding protein [Propionibacteriales bacterium]|nr:MetQ/NlpA family ABC transporter substrate-binding protein [Propionibacteriales bacterium]
MNRRIFLGGLGLLSLAATTGCGAAAAAGTGPLRIAASPVPHAEILNRLIESGALESGSLDILEISGDLDPNAILEAGDIDANFFQHVPYAKDWAAQNKVENLANVAEVHVEPLGLYSKKITDLAKVPQGVRLALPNNVTNFARGLFLLQDAGLIKLDVAPDKASSTQVTEKNVTENPHKINFTQVDAPQLARALDDPTIQLAVINGNYALEAGLIPATDALAIETADQNPYANVLTTLTDKVNDERITKLAAALTSPELGAWITEKYQGSVIPVKRA